MKLNQINRQSLRLFPLIFTAMLISNFSGMAQNKKENTAQPIVRMGSSNTQPFDEGWFFARFGMQADGTSLP